MSRGRRDYPGQGNSPATTGKDKCLKKYEFIPFLRNFCLYEKLVKSNKLFSRKKRIKFLKLNVFLKKQTALCAELFR